MVMSELCDWDSAYEDTQVQRCVNAGLGDCGFFLLDSLLLCSHPNCILAFLWFAGFINFSNLYSLSRLSPLLNCSGTLNARCTACAVELEHTYIDLSTARRYPGPLQWCKAQWDFPPISGNAWSRRSLILRTFLHVQKVKSGKAKTIWRLCVESWMAWKLVVFRAQQSSKQCSTTFVYLIRMNQCKISISSLLPDIQRLLTNVSIVGFNSVASDVSLHSFGKNVFLSDAIPSHFVTCIMWCAVHQCSPISKCFVSMYMWWFKEVNMAPHASMIWTDQRQQHILAFLTRRTGSRRR